MMPVFWASEEGSLTHSLANKFKGKVYGPKYGMEAGVWGGVGLGGRYMSVCLVWVGEVVAVLASVLYTHFSMYMYTEPNFGRAAPIMQA